MTAVIAYLWLMACLLREGFRAIPTILRAIRRLITWLLDCHERGMKRIREADPYTGRAN